MTPCPFENLGRTLVSSCRWGYLISLMTDSCWGPVVSCDHVNSLRDFESVPILLSVDVTDGHHRMPSGQAMPMVGLYLGQITGHQCMIMVCRSGSKCRIRFANFASNQFNRYCHGAINIISLEKLLLDPIFILTVKQSYSIWIDFETH